MSLPVRFTREVVPSGRTSLFAGKHVQLDEGSWSPAFEAHVNAWSRTSTLLVVLENADAMLHPMASAPCVDARPRPMERCGVFRFDNAVVAPRTEQVVVQLAPRALLRYYWRRHALMLGYPSPAEHVEEDAIGLLRHVASRVEMEAKRKCASEGQLRHRALAREARALMAERVAEPHPIAQVARALNTSPFHLAHVFRTEVGSSPHKYLVQLRIVAALVQLRDGARDLSKLALELGFSHHSHFTAAFRRSVGYTPSEVRRMLTSGSIADMGIVARCSGAANEGASGRWARAGG